MMDQSLEAMVLKSLCCDTPTRRVRIGWLSFQKSGDISFGLCDNTFIAPKFEAVIGIWNVYNRVRTSFEIVSDPSAAEQVVNPHLTWHAPNYFHLKSQGQRAEDASFQGIADIPLMLQQESETKWIRATSGPVDSLRTAIGSLRGRWDSEVLTIQVPTESLSVQISIDFVRRSVGPDMGHSSRWYIPWHQVGIRLTMGFTYPHFPTLAWAHYH
ncbi:hypothetical protein [Bradyrhizobium sp. CCBAU 53415]|uniref:hypothetical protein n=1 Tax=Bradyrhizobium sp. CCBAU 53415 TaxID=1325119 RepID=UPI002305EFA1|nr:hypothetical protein [Bradyrhizobium sp. CCBAU 53415]